MLFSYQKLLAMPVLSLRSLTPIGTTSALIINPGNLHVDAFVVGIGQKTPKFLLSQQVREVSPKAILINDQEDLSDYDDLIRLQEIIQADYSPLKKKVVNSTGKLGTVTGFAVDRDSLFIVKLYARPSLFKNFLVSELTIDRTTIVDVTPKQIVVKDSTVQANESLSAALENGRLASGYSSPSSANTSATSE